MRIGYFSAAWQDIRNSPGWVGKMLLMSLLMLIPVFGWIVVYGYLLGWARDIAWGVHAPLPARLFGNEDGKLYSRGFFAGVISLVCNAVPFIVEMVGGVVLGVGTVGLFLWGWNDGSLMPAGATSAVAAVVLPLVVFALSLFVGFFRWVGWMRMAVYGRLSAGFQVGRIWAMMRHDFGGIMRIFGMSLILGAALILGALVLGIVLCVILFLVIFVGAWLSVLLVSLGAMVAIIAFMTVLLAYGYAVGVMATFSTMVTVRALGYWTRQFDVPAWRGQDDPMPFELAGAPVR